jgi:hypothetical protein
VTTPVWFASIRFTAEQFRNEELMVGYDPLPPENPFHGEVWGNFTKGKMRRLLKAAQWFVQPADVTLG